MTQPTPPPPDPSNSSEKEKSEIGIGSILGLSLFLGLMVGAAIDKSHILPATVICAIILYTNRHKIAAQDTTVRAKPMTAPKEYFAWPKLNQFPVTISAVPYQQEIQQLAKENPFYSEEDADATNKRFFQALLVPVNDNPYDDNVIRVDIGDHTVGYLSYDQARSFRQKLKDNQLSNQTTTCTAALIENDATKPEIGKTIRYGIKLDIELPE